MRKFWGLVLFGLLFANNAFAVIGIEDGGTNPSSTCTKWTGACSSSHQENFQSMEIVAGDSDTDSLYGDVACKTSESACYTSSLMSPNYWYIESCLSCPAGYELAVVVAKDKNNHIRDCKITYKVCVEATCPSECPSETEWTSISTGMEAKCVIQSGVGGCMKRCKDGYYQTWKGRWDFEHDWPGSFRCQKCPENAVPCTGNLDGDMIKCEQNYYRIDNASSTSSYVNMECIRCPYYGAVPTVTAGTGATSVNRCYVPNTQHMRDGAGNEFRFKSNCYYTGDYDPDGNYPVSTHPKPID